MGVSVEMDALKKGWFSEVNGLWPGQAMSLEVEEVLHSEKSQFQDILIFQRSSIALYWRAYCHFAIDSVASLYVVSVRVSAISRCDSGMCACAYEVIAGAIEVQFVCAMLAGVCVFQALVCSRLSLVQCTKHV